MYIQRTVAIFGLGFLCVLGILVFVGFVGFEIYLDIRFWNMPISEIPYWAATFLFNRG